MYLYIYNTGKQEDKVDYPGKSQTTNQRIVSPIGLILYITVTSRHRARVRLLEGIIQNFHFIALRSSITRCLSRSYDINISFMLKFIGSRI